MAMPRNRMNMINAPYPQATPNGEAEEDLGKFYMIEVVLITAAGSGATVNTTPSEPIGPDDFIWEELGADWNSSNGKWKIKITDDGEGQPFSPGYVEVGGLVGSTEREPYKLRHPWRFKGGGAIMVEAINNGSAGDTLSLQFIGKRMTGRGQPQ